MAAVSTCGVLREDGGEGRDFDDIFDIVAVRVIAPTVKDRYAALGCIHGNWRPVVGRFKDYIAMPKFNLIKVFDDGNWCKRQAYGSSNSYR